MSVPVLKGDLGGTLRYPILYDVWFMFSNDSANQVDDRRKQVWKQGDQ